VPRNSAIRDEAMPQSDPDEAIPMKRSKSSQRWLQRQAGDPYVRQSKLDGYRSRAAYKLIELQRKDRLMRPGMTVVDLGAAPGGWSQVAAREVGAGGRVLALDLLQMEPIDGVDLIIGDFHEDSVLGQALAWAGEAGVDLVLSDMAPTISGMRAVDQPRSMLLVELAVDFAARVLKPGGAFATKVFQGEGFDATLRDLRGRFSTVACRKPESSRKESRETYFVAKGLRVG